MQKRKQFLAERKCHLENKRAAIEGRLADKHMPEKHRQYKLELLKKIAEALLQIGNGSYGFCKGCNKEIPAKRLELRPEAEFCVNCQERKERDAQTKNTETRLINLAA